MFLHLFTTTIFNKFYNVAKVMRVNPVMPYQSENHAEKAPHNRPVNCIRYYFCYETCFLQHL